MTLLYDGRTGYESPEYQEYHQLLDAGMLSESILTGMFGRDKLERLVRTKALRPQGYDSEGLPYFDREEALQHTQYQPPDNPRQGCCKCCGHCAESGQAIATEGVGHDSRMSIDPRTRRESQSRQYGNKLIVQKGLSGDDDVAYNFDMPKLTPGHIRNYDEDEDYEDRPVHPQDRLAISEPDEDGRSTAAKHRQADYEDEEDLGITPEMKRMAVALGNRVLNHVLLNQLKAAYRKRFGRSV